MLDVFSAQYTLSSTTVMAVGIVFLGRLKNSSILRPSKSLVKILPLLDGPVSVQKSLSVVLSIAKPEKLNR